ncbi:MAG: coenzyme F420-0:L-glutamate ligase [Pseudomonadales bacterium]|jgi:coenzyme F420-0:L-glutamate ligase/coenzyme F420-1:gamma-L-glutamate ligase|nr:coenzyme F420-0:L-glutamate ligase [Pseudomonadales bacterium]
MISGLHLHVLQGIPLLSEGDDLATLLLDAVARAGLVLADGDVLVIAQKIVSKVEGRRVALATVTPSAEARTLAEETGKDARLVELILRESVRVVRKRPGRPGVIVVEHRRGWVHANAGIDQSNVTDGDPGAWALLLPEDPDRSARALRETLGTRTGTRIGVVINDSAGRAWRMGTCGIALGSAGLTTLEDLRGRADLFGRRMEVSVVGRADEIAAAASLAMGQAAEGTPAVLLRGLPVEDTAATAAELIRPAAEDMFR